MLFRQQLNNADSRRKKVADKPGPWTNDGDFLPFASLIGSTEQLGMTVDTANFARLVKYRKHRFSPVPSQFLAPPHDAFPSLPGSQTWPSTCYPDFRGSLLSDRSIRRKVKEMI